MGRRVAGWLRIIGEHSLDLMFAAAIAIAMFAMGMYTAQSEVVAGAALLEGSSINGIDVSRMDPDQAMEMVVRLEEERLLGAVSLTLCAQEEEFVYGARELGATTDAGDAIGQVIDKTRTGNLLSRTSAYYRLRDGVTCDIKVLYSPERAQRICQTFAEQFYKPPVDASMKLADSGDAFDYVSDVSGAKVDQANLYHLVWEQLSQGAPGRVEVPVHSVEAQVPLQLLSDNTMALSSCETALDGEQDALIRRMLASINGYALQASEELSLRDLLYSNGYVPKGEEAAAAQVATTLYDALLLAGAGKVERHPNDIPPAYVGKGLDAALDNDRNLVMRNDSKFPVYILAGTQEGMVRIEVHGRLMRLDETIQIRTGTVNTIEPEPPLFIDDPSLPMGKTVLITKARVGYKVSSYRETLREDAVIANELLAMDIYPAVREEYHNGTGR